MSSVTDRNNRLDALVTATQQWAAKAQADITQRVATCELILKGRTGATRLAQSAVTAASAVVANSIDDFLVP